MNMQTSFYMPLIQLVTVNETCFTELYCDMSKISGWRCHTRQWFMRQANCLNETLVTH